MKNLTTTIIFIILCFSLQCDSNRPEPIRPCTLNCLNGGSCEYGWLFPGMHCRCPEGYCGDKCENTIEDVFYGNYTGTMVCESDTVITQIKVVEHKECLISELIFNDGDLFTVKYWGGGVINYSPYNSYSPPDIWVGIGSGFNSGKPTGELTSDSLIFYVINSVDTCYYTGVRE